MGRRRHRENEEQRGGRRTRLDLWTHDDEPARPSSIKSYGATTEEPAGSVASSVGQAGHAASADPAGGKTGGDAPAAPAPNRLLALLGGYSDDGDADDDDDDKEDVQEAGHGGANGRQHNAAVAAAPKPGGAPDVSGGEVAVSTFRAHQSHVAAASSHAPHAVTAVPVGKERSPLTAGAGSHAIPAVGHGDLPGRAQHESVAVDPAASHGQADAAQGGDEYDDKVADFLNELKGSGLLDETQEAVEEDRDEGGGKAGPIGTDGEHTQVAPDGHVGAVLGARAGGGGGVVPDRGAGAAPAIVVRRLPKPWTKVRDESSGDFYFWNTETGETSWDAPALVEEMVMPAADAAAGDAREEAAATTQGVGATTQGVDAGKIEAEGGGNNGVRAGGDVAVHHGKEDVEVPDDMAGLEADRREATKEADRREATKEGEEEEGDAEAQSPRSAGKGAVSSDDEGHAVGRGPARQGSPSWGDVAAVARGEALPPLADEEPSPDGAANDAVAATWQELEEAGQDLNARLQYIEDQAPGPAKQQPPPALRLCRRMAAEMRLRLDDMARLRGWVEEHGLMGPDAADPDDGAVGREADGDDEDDRGGSPWGRDGEAREVQVRDVHVTSGRGRKGRGTGEGEGSSERAGGEVGSVRDGARGSNRAGSGGRKGGRDNTWGRARGPGEGAVLCLALIRWLQDNALQRLRQMSAEAWVLQEEVLAPVTMPPALSGEREQAVSPLARKGKAGGLGRGREDDASPSSSSPSSSSSMSTSSLSPSSSGRRQGSEEGEIQNTGSGAGGAGASDWRAGSVDLPAAGGAVGVGRHALFPASEGPPGVDYPTPPPEWDAPYPPLPETPGLPPPPEDEDAPPPLPPDESWFRNASSFVPPAPAAPFDPSTAALYPAVPGYSAGVYGAVIPAVAAAAAPTLGVSAYPAPYDGTPYATQAGDVLAAGGLTGANAGFLQPQPTVLAAAATAAPLEHPGHAASAAPTTIHAPTTAATTAAPAPAQAARPEGGGAVPAAMPRPSSLGTLGSGVKEKSKKKAGAGASISVAPLVGKSLGQSKKMNALLGKWKAARQEIEGAEDKEDAHMDLGAMERKKQQELERWRLEQLQSGEAESNANFAPLNASIDWRERVRKARERENTAATGDVGAEPAGGGTAAANEEPAEVVAAKSSTASEAMEGGAVTASSAAAAPKKRKVDLAALSKGLPAGWQAFFDKASGDVYYGNLSTSETSWERPS